MPDIARKTGTVRPSAAASNPAIGEYMTRPAQAKTHRVSDANSALTIQGAPRRTPRLSSRG